MQEHLLYSFSVPECLHLAATDVVKSWFDGVCETAEMMGLVATMTKKFTYLYSVAL